MDCVEWEVSRGGERGRIKYQCRGNQGLEPTCSVRFPLSILSRIVTLNLS